MEAPGSVPEDYPEITGYRVEKMLGQGGMANVYLANQEFLDRKVALKVLKPGLLEDNPSFARRFLKEAETAASIIHPNIVTIFQVGHSCGYYFIGMEYLPESLRERINWSEPRGIEPFRALEITATLAAALAFAHREGFIHRDIKPDNILFRKDGTPVIADFGIARDLDAQTKFTMTGTVIGTPHYMSPEQCRGDAVDGRSDFYSLGVVLFEMLAGDVPYKAENTAGVLVKHIQAPLPQLPSHLRRFQPLIDALMAKSPAKRPNDGEQVRRLIAKLPTAPEYPTLAESRSTLELTPGERIDGTQSQAAVLDAGSFPPFQAGETTTTATPTGRRKLPAMFWVMFLAVLIMILVYLVTDLYVNLRSPRPQPPGETVRKDNQAQPAIPPAVDAAAGVENGAQTRKNGTNGASSAVPEKTADTRPPAEEQTAVETPETKKRRRLDDQAFQQAVAAGGIAALEKYLQDFPQGAHTADAVARRDALKRAAVDYSARETMAYETAASADTIESFQRYLDAFPTGPNRAKAEARLGQLRDKTVAETKVKFEIQPPRFFAATGLTPPSQEARAYSERFVRAETRYIFVEFAYRNKLYRLADAANNVVVEISGALNTPIKGGLRSSREERDGVYTRGMGWAEAGKWPAGEYIVRIILDGEEAGRGRFTVE